MSEPNPTYAHEKPANKSSALEQALRENERLRERAENAELRLQRIDEGSEEAQREADDIMRESLMFKAERDALRAQLEKAKAALRLYADHKNWDGDPNRDLWIETNDGWVRAEIALKEMDDA